MENIVTGNKIHLSQPEGSKEEGPNQGGQIQYYETKAQNGDITVEKGTKYRSLEQNCEEGEGPQGAVAPEIEKQEEKDQIFKEKFKPKYLFNV